MSLRSIDSRIIAQRRAHEFSNKTGVPLVEAKDVELIQQLRFKAIKPFRRSMCSGQD